MTVLLDLCKQLAHPEKVVVWVEADGKRVMHAHVEPPLVDRVRAAIGSQLGSGAGGSSLAGERCPIDPTAFALWQEINGEVREWLTDAKVANTPELSVSIMRWLVWFQRDVREPVEEPAAFNKLSSWVARCRDVVEPADRIEITSPCPDCGRRWVTFGSGSELERRSALSASLRGSDDAWAECSACGRRWVGVSALRSLRVWIDEKEAA